MLKRAFIKMFLSLRNLKYSLLSENKNVHGKVNKHQPLVLKGQGSIQFGKSVHIGVINSPLFYNTYAYLEARPSGSQIIFGDNVRINNGFSIISEKKITIGNNVLMGYNCNISDSSFHDLDPAKRTETDPLPQEVLIEDNVFLGNNVTILKGVQIGKNSVVASGAVVTKSFPTNVIIGGVPAAIIKNL